MAAFGWRYVFYTFGALGVPLLVAWLTLVPRKSAGPAIPSFASKQPGDDPTAAGAIGSGGQAAAVGAVPQQRVTALGLMSKSATWAIIIINIVNHWG